MSFEPLNKISSQVVLLQSDNIDTDRIIPARFLKSVDSAGFGKNLFHDWRYRADGSPDPDFVLNRPEGKGQILLTGRNFGCGSSREHAAWALYQHGFRVIISPGFADIFKNNALNNGLLPVEVKPEQLDELIEACHLSAQKVWKVDLETQLLSPPVPGIRIHFDIDPIRRQCLMTGSDLVDYLTNLKPEIIAFENSHPTSKI